jgi:phosphatidylethanolamine/phosphatidyl-N-methylethanolamine N-methyltransferase
MTALRKTYDRIAPIYDLLDGPYEHVWKRRLRDDVFRGLTGDILDAGVGTGCNIPAYPLNARITAVDASEPMLLQARRRARRAGRAVDLRCMDLGDLAFRDASFDAVVATFVFMCIPEDAQLGALREVARVCRPDGEVRLVDYCMSERPVLRVGMRIMSPWLKFAFAGSYRPHTNDYFDEAGLVVVEERMLFGDVVKLRILRRVNHRQ